MKSISKMFFAASLALTTTYIYADQVTCPDGIHFVNIGSTIDQFEAVCGQPKSTTSSNASGSASGYYVWTYHDNPQTTSHGNTNLMYSAAGSTSFVIENGKVGAIRLTSFGQSRLAQQATCGLETVAVGMSTNQLKLFCGSPSSMEQLTRVPGQSKQALPEQTILQYQAQSYMPVVSYSFANGQLVGKQ